MLRAIEGVTANKLLVLGLEAVLWTIATRTGGKLYWGGPEAVEHFRTRRTERRRRNADFCHLPEHSLGGVYRKAGLRGHRCLGPRL